MARITLQNGAFNESPTGTFNITIPAQLTLRTGITALQFRDEGANLFDITITFLAQDLAVDFQTNKGDINMFGEYILDVFMMNAPVDGVINDSLIFIQDENYDDFKRQFQTDKLIEFILPPKD